jgi:hypothetical protein
VRIVVEPTSCARMTICVQADRNAQVLKGYLEDKGVLGVAREAGRRI